MKVFNFETCLNLFCDRHKKRTIRIIASKNRFTHAELLFKDMDILNVYKINIFQTICLIEKIKLRLAPSVFFSLYK